MTDLVVEPFADFSRGEPHVQGFLHRPAEPGGDGLVLTHGAGGNSTHPFLVALAASFAARGLTVLCADLPYRQARRRGPPAPGRSELDREGLRRAVGALRPLIRARCFLGGHSYGGRQASLLAASDPGLVTAVLLLSYPLHPPRRPGALRVGHFPTLRVPAMFVQGSADPFGTLDEMRAALGQVAGPTALVPIDGAGHDLTDGRRRSRPGAASTEGVVTRFLDWVANGYCLSTNR
jgi:predicted alpha/beta-hydrolase family hydrolase